MVQRFVAASALYESFFVVANIVNLLSLIKTLDLLQLHELSEAKELPAAQLALLGALPDKVLRSQLGAQRPLSKRPQGTSVITNVASAIEAPPKDPRK